MAEFFAAVRVRRISRIQDLAAMTNHARGLDENCRLRMVKPGPRALAWSLATGDRILRPVEVGDESPATDLVAAFRKHKKEQGASEHKGRAFALHMLVVVSPEWIDEAGTPKAKKDREVKLTKEAVKWANETLGPDAVFGARYDVNELGQGVVDLFVSPVRDQQIGRGRKWRRKIAPNQALRQLGEKYGRKYSFSAVQDSWAEHAQATLDPRLQRGKEKQTFGPDRLTPEAHGAKANEAKAIAAAEKAAERERQAEADAARKVKQVEELTAQVQAERRAKEQAEAETQRALAAWAKAEAEATRAIAVKATAEQEAREAKEVSEKAGVINRELTAKLVGLGKEKDRLTKANGALAQKYRGLAAARKKLRIEYEKLKANYNSLKPRAEGFAALWDIAHDEGGTIARHLVKPAWELVHKTVLPAIRKAAWLHRVELEREPTAHDGGMGVADIER